MTKKQLFSLLLALALGVSLLAGCGKPGGDASGGSSAGDSSAGDSSAQAAVEPMDLSAVTDPYLATAGLSGGETAAKLGEYDISAADLLYWLNYSIERYLSQTGGSSGAGLDWEMSVGNQTLREYLTQGALETAALYRLIPELAAREGVELTQEDRDYLAADLADGAEQMGSEELLDHALWYQLRTREQYSGSLTAGMLYNHLSDLWYGEDSGNYPTDAEVRSYADEQGCYKVKHILLSNKGEDGSTLLDGAALAEKKAQADSLLAQLRAAEDPIALFDELMRQYSEDPGLAAYPDGYDAYKGQMVPEFEEASLALKDGEISDVVESAHGYHIILRLPLEVEQFRSEMISSQMDERIQAELDRTPPQVTEAWERVDFGGFRIKVLSLQAAVRAEFQAKADAEPESGGEPQPAVPAEPPAPDDIPTPDGTPAPDSASSAPEEPPAVRSGIADADGGLNMRSGPGSDHEVIAVVPKGAALTVLEDAGDGWYRAEYGGAEGFVSKDYVLLVSD